MVEIAKSDQTSLDAFDLVQNLTQIDFTVAVGLVALAELDSTGGLGELVAENLHFMLAVYFKEAEQ